jgi:hypothetical protein
MGGHKEHRVKVDASSENHARNLGAEHFEKKGLKARVHFDGVRVVKEEVDLDEMTQGKEYTQAQLQKKIQSGNWEATHDIKPGKHVEMRHHTGKKVMVQVKEDLEQIDEGAYEKSEENKRSADAAKKQGDMFAHHLHMADHHENLSQWHSSKGRHGEADKHAEKAEEHQDLAMKHKVKKEEVEQIDELKKSTLASYAKKATNSMDTHAYHAYRHQDDGDYDKKEKRKQGISKAVDRLAKEEVEQIDEDAPLKHHTAIVSYRKNGDPHRRYEARFKTTHNGGKEETEKRVKTAFAAKGRSVYNIVHEEVEQIDELSKKTLSSYAKSATSSMRGVATSAQVAGSLDRDDPHYKKYSDRTHKRIAGVEKAVDRLAKEEVSANNVGDGKIAGTQGDAGKKSVMTKKPLKRFKDLMDK